MGLRLLNPWLIGRRRGCPFQVFPKRINRIPPLIKVLQEGAEIEVGLDQVRIQSHSRSVFLQGFINLPIGGQGRTKIIVS